MWLASMTPLSVLALTHARGQLTYYCMAPLSEDTVCVDWPSPKILLAWPLALQLAHEVCVGNFGGSNCEEMYLWKCQWRPGSDRWHGVSCGAMRVLKKQLSVCFISKEVTDSCKPFLGVGQRGPPAKDRIEVGIGEQFLCAIHPVYLLRTARAFFCCTLQKRSSLNQITHTRCLMLHEQLHLLSLFID